MFSFHLTLHESQIECTPSILRQAVQRQLQEFTDAHSTLLKNEDHLHPRSFQTAQMRVQLVQDRSRNVARLRLWWSRYFFIKDHSLGSDRQPALACGCFDEVPEIEQMTLTNRDADPRG